jgi:mono/diheme cytochrome c family protein
MTARPLFFFALVAMLASPARGDDAPAAATPTAAPRSPLAGLPREVDPRPLGVGRRVPDASARDLSGAPRALAALLGPRATVVALTSTTCPVSKRLAPVLARLEADLAPRGVPFVFVNVDASDTEQACREQVAAHGLRGAYLLDREGAITAALGASTTTEVFVLDAARTLQYRGAVSDQYGIDFARAAPAHEWLARAVDAVLADRAPAVAATTAPGCALEVRRPEAAAAPPTYHGRISRIVAQNCLECHRAGGVGPFPLETYAQVAAKAGTIAHVVEHRIMPPWLAAQPAAGAPSPWANERSLTEEDRAAVLAWVAAGKPEGDAREAAAPRRFPPDWAIGTPDVVFELPEAVDVAAEGVMDYVLLRVPTGFTEDRWVSAIEVQPTARGVVHHVLVFAVPPQQPGERRRRDNGLRGFFGAYAPGAGPVSYPAGYAKRLPAGSDLLFQLHYTPNGQATRDRTRIALVFAKGPPEHIVRMAGIATRRLEIAPGEKDHTERAMIPVPLDVKVLAFMPHMHVRGSAFRFEAVRPGEAAVPLLEVPRWDFNWQLRYVLREPLDLPRGSVVSATGWYDNSADNPNNPDPKATVHWGLQTTDEMMLGYVEFVLAKEDPSLPDELGGGRRGARPAPVDRDPQGGALR